MKDNLDLAHEHLARQDRQQVEYLKEVNSVAEIPMIKHFTFFEAALFKADVIRFENDSRYTIIDSHFKNGKGGFIEYMYKD